MSKVRSKITLTNRRGVCPICGEEHLVYMATDVSDSWMGTDWKCNNCQAEGRECFKIEFDTQDQINFKKDDGQNYYIDDLKNYGIDTDDEDDVEDDIPQLD
jgi:hypothetical protein